MEEVPLLKDLHTRYANQATIVGISVDTNVERVDRVIKERAMTWPILADGRGFDGPIPKAYHIQGTPELFVLDREGKIYGRLGSAKQLEAKLKEALIPARDAETAGQGGASIKGRVVDAATKAPLARARVRLSGSSQRGPVLTDDAGAFVFDRLPGGTYSFLIERSGYLSTSWPDTSRWIRRREALITLAATDHMENVTY